MIARFFNYIFHTITWNFMFRFITRMNFRLITSNFRAHLLTLSIMQSLLFLRDLILNRVSNNIFFRIVSSTPTIGGVSPNDLINTNPKKIFWVVFVSTLILYKQYILFKKFILWPFKIGIYAFIYAVSGFDVSWILSCFDIFRFNVPQWVYIQYLNLYSSWISWWKDTAKINNLKPESIPKAKVKILPIKPESVEVIKKPFLTNTEIIITLSVAILICGIIIWYYWDVPGSGGGNGNNIIYPNPPAPNYNTIPHTISIIDNQTPAIPPILDNPVGSISHTGRELLDNAVDWGRAESGNLNERLESLKQDPSKSVPILNNPWGLENDSSTSSLIDRSSSPSGSDGSGETVTQNSIKQAQMDIFFTPRD